MSDSTVVPLRGHGPIPRPQEQRRSNEYRQRAAEPFRPKFLSEYQGYVPPAREWLVDGLILRKTVSLFAGPPKAGKTLALHQMAIALATGRPWLDHETVPARVFGLYTEEPEDEVGRRTLSICSHLGIEPMDIEGNASIDARAEMDGTLVDFDRGGNMHFTPLWHQTWEYIQDCNFDVVQFDPTGVIFNGNGNDKRHVTPFVRACARKAIEINGAVILAQHPAKADPKGYSGDAAWVGSTRFAMSLHRPEDYDPITGQNERNRILAGLGGNYVTSRLYQHLTFQDDVLMVDEHYRAERTRLPTWQLDYELLTRMRRVIENGARIPADEMARDSMPNRVRRSPDTTIKHTALNDLYASQDRLLADGKVIRVNVGGRCMIRPADGVCYPGEAPWTTQTQMEL